MSKLREMVKRIIKEESDKRGRLIENEIPHGFTKLNGRSVDTDKVEWGGSEIFFNYNGKWVQDKLLASRKESNPQFNKFYFIVSHKFGRIVSPSDVIAIKY